ncbi:MAG: hypothetical protein H0T65_17250, partial [Deltaproteobacteria bacterium]|nr:hypothetical protein [Deltaproteobacteria bacterium]
MGKKVKTADPLAPVRTNPTKVTTLELNPAASRNAGTGWFEPLPVFPPEILGCKNLVELEIYRGIIDGTIPEGIGTLTKLKALGLGGLSTTQLPESLGKLTKLETLSLAYMQSLRELPVSIGKLTKLRELDMAYAGITALPAIGALRALRTANFANTALTSVHPALWQCSALETLSFPDTLESLPPGIAKLTKLRTLSASPSALASIAVELPKLKLTALHVHGAGELPAEVGLIKTLGELRANFLGLTSLPDTLPQLANLESLEVSGNKLATLIDLVARFPKLVNFDYSGNPVAVSERRELDKLMKLSPSKRIFSVAKRVPAPVKTQPKAKLARIGQVASVNASLSLIIA